MTEGTVTPQEYFKGFPEAPTSDTIKWFDTHGIEHMTTIRAWSPEGLIQAVDRFIAARFESGDAQPANKPAPQQPTYQPIDDGGNALPDIKTAQAGRLSVEMKDNKYYWKVVDAVFAPGEKGTKYGISVYPEVFKAAGLDVREGQPVPSIAGWTVNYILNDKGYPGKVTRLLPPK